MATTTTTATTTQRATATTTTPTTATTTGAGQHSNIIPDCIFQEICAKFIKNCRIQVIEIEESFSEDLILYLSKK